MKANDAKRLKEFERENGQLKHLVTDKELEVLAHEGIGGGNWCARPGGAERSARGHPIGEGSSVDGPASASAAGSGNQPPRVPIASTPSARALDFQHDATADCRELKFLDVVDECTREALAIELRRTIDADATVAVLERLVAKRGAPTNLRADNGPGLTARVLREWCEAGSTDSACLDPGAPWQKAWVESLNARLRDEVLDVEAFSTLAEVRFLGVRVTRGLQQRAFPLGASHDVAEPIRCQLAANRKDERITQPRARRRGADR